MRMMIVAAVAGLALVGCNGTENPQAEQLEAQADAVEQQADNRAEAIEEAGENRADALNERADMIEDGEQLGTQPGTPPAAGSAPAAPNAAGTPGELGTPPATPEGAGENG